VVSIRRQVAGYAQGYPPGLGIGEPQAGGGSAGEPSIVVGGCREYVAGGLKGGIDFFPG
jgi:hypothetical protein